jgi:hypothetical protein
MIINIQQGTKDTKLDYLEMLDILENCGYRIFDIGCHDKIKKLSEAVLIKDKNQLN